MKKLLAILLSALMLCAMIPFATVAAAGEHYVELVADAEEVNAGDEITVEVSLYGHESIGLIGAQIELGYDHDVFELVTNYDEDEEMWLPAIEVGAKFNASSNKYIMFGPINEETGESKNCVAQYLRATATAAQAVKTNLFYTATFKVKDDAVSGDYTIEVINHHNKNIVMHGNQIAEWSMNTIAITVNGSEPEVPSCEHEYEYDCSKICTLCGEESRPDADHQQLYTCDQFCMHCGEKAYPGAAHNIIHVEAKEAVSCIEFGNKEYWHCDACGAAWLDANGRYQTNMMSVLTAGECISNAAACQDGECINCGLPCYAEAEHEYFNDCESVCINCYEETREASHNVVHVEAKAATCTAMGNIEYWYCDVCGAAWLDADCTRNTNRFAVILPMADHTYANALDASCDVCGTERDLTAVANEIIQFSGNSTTEIKGGLGFKFSANVNGLSFNEEYIADYTNATITIDGVEYKLVTLGAIVNNKQLGNQTLDNVDGKYVKNVEAVKVFEGDNGATSYAVRIINIPAEYLDAEIIARPYFVCEADGEQIIIYGEDQIQSYNGALN